MLRATVGARTVYDLVTAAGVGNVSVVVVADTARCQPTIANSRLLSCASFVFSVRDASALGRTTKVFRSVTLTSWSVPFISASVNPSSTVDASQAVARRTSGVVVRPWSYCVVIVQSSVTPTLTAAVTGLGVSASVIDSAAYSPIVTPCTADVVIVVVPPDTTSMSVTASASENSDVRAGSRMAAWRYSGVICII